MRVVWNLFKYLLAFGLLAWVLYLNWEPKPGTGLSQLYRRYFIDGETIHYGYLALAVLVGCLALCVSFFRWYFLVRALDLPFTIGSAFRLGFIGFFFNTVLPGSVGGDIVKAAAIAREQDRRTLAVATVLMDRGIGVWGLLWLVVAACAVCLGFGWSSPEATPVVLNIFRAAGTLLAVSVVVWWALGLLPDVRAERFRQRLSGIPKAGPALAELWWAVWLYRRKPSAVVLALVISWVAQIGYTLTFFFGAMTLWDGARPMPTLAEHFAIMPLGLVAESIPLFPGGIGVGEVAFGKLYQLFGSETHYGVQGALMRRLIQFGLGLVGYLIYLQMRARIPPQPVGET